MKRRSRLMLVYTNCTRCSKPLTTLNRSLYGADALKSKLGSICSDCITPEERHEMEQGIGQAALRSASVTR